MLPSRLGASGVGVYEQPTPPKVATSASERESERFQLSSSAA